jgi:2-polyprenyl-6-methoxyphenol hydroxylase-like FAD-dependent oxidoreductase
LFSGGRFLYRETMAEAQVLETQCCIAGGGPAGMMLGLLLARAGVDVVVLEKHADFFRDFRGDTIHPSTLDVMRELGLLDAFLALPHQEVRELSVQIGDERIGIADLRHVPTACKFVAIMPQWDFLDFLAQAARRYPPFRLMMNAEATDLVYDGKRVAGVQVVTPSGPLTVRAALVVAADGRHSTLRARAGFEVVTLGAPIDVLWVRIPRRSDHPGNAFGVVNAGKLLVLINRGDYFQAAVVIPKGGFDEIGAAGIGAFRESIVDLAPFLRDGVEAIRDWDDVRLLTVMVDRLRQWYAPGLLCIGDAAHAMSPIGGIGINLAVQDAVAAANLLAEPLLDRTLGTEYLRAVEERRILPTRLTQGLQVFLQDNVIVPILRSKKKPSPGIVRVLEWFPYLRRIPARIIGVGFRPEHVNIPEYQASTSSA